MSTRRLWAIVGGAAALVVIVVLLVVTLNPKATEAQPSPSPSGSAEPTETPAPLPSATPSPTASAPTATAATCENTSTDAFRSMMASNGWVSWETQNQQIGATPFQGFPNGTPEGAIVCRWGADPNLATDNIIDLAWTAIGPENAVAAMAGLENQGYTRIEEPQGIYLAVPGEPGYSDEDGWGPTYFFGFDDVGWAATKADVTDYVKAPGEAG
jgi:hypothetical protein